SIRSTGGNGGNGEMVLCCYPPDCSFVCAHFMLWLQPKGRAKKSATSADFLPLLAALQALGGFDQLEEFRAVVAGVFAEPFLRELRHGVKSSVALELRLPQDHAEQGHRGGELEIGRGLCVRTAGILGRRFDQLA